MKIKIGFFLFLLLTLMGCQRYFQFKRDVEFEKPDVPLEMTGQPKKKVLVLDFWNDTPMNSEDIGEFVADELRRGLDITQRVLISTGPKESLKTRDFVDGDQIRVA